MLATHAVVFIKTTPLGEIGSNASWRSLKPLGHMVQSLLKKSTSLLNIYNKQL